MGTASAEVESGDPVSVDLNVDAALVLKDMVGIDTYPLVLSITPNIYRISDRDRVRAVVAAQLTADGIISDGEVDPVVAGWLRCLDRPDTELVIRVLDNGRGGETPTMLRVSLVRRGEHHVLAVRCDDEIVIQSVFHQGRQLDTLTAVLESILGDYPVLDFEPFTRAETDPEEPPQDADGVRAGLRELGASPRTANVLTRALGEIVRQAEVLMIEHRDGGPETPDFTICMNVLDTFSGRFVITPSVTLDGRTRSTFRPGDHAALQSGINTLAELLPGRSWFDTARTG
ncbi:ESX secretion-associated protein EspG [Nocardia jinanensis]|uniref:ESX secretion-associated protein EspG n=1 Tax=Nocardia jinanensis TaxID=382504 RepID=UPI001E5308A7|nr:ESX secretion-associated protein EspG [Nocardia jinanensis]